MSHFLWEYFYNEEFNKFQKLLSESLQDTLPLHSVKIRNSSSHPDNDENNSPLRHLSNRRRTSGYKDTLHSGLSRAEINSRDYAGLTILHRVVSSKSIYMIPFAKALLDHPAINIYAQDTENGWTALHRALYFGNIIIARAIIEKDSCASYGKIRSISQKESSSIINVEDYEGNTAFDVYNESILRPAIKVFEHEKPKSMHEDRIVAKLPNSIDGDEILAWGSNRNHGLGFKDQDDRRHPEKITLQRRDHLHFRFYQEYLKQRGDDERWRHDTKIPKLVSDLPSLITNRPIIIKDVVLSKLHSAILTTDPESNLYMCGFGPGGRLGTGDQETRFTYVPVDGGPLTGQEVSKVALGQDHTLAVLTDGSLIAWGSNMHCQLGFFVSSSNQEGKDNISTHPQAIAGALKKEFILGAAASTYHSVAYTSTSIYAWGKNDGQLGLMDFESQSVEYQPKPRKVASSVIHEVPIVSVSAIDNATVILLSTQTVIVLINYRSLVVKLPMSEGFSRYNLKNGYFKSCNCPRQNLISSITAGGNTIGAVSTRGDLFILTTKSNSKSSKNSTTTPTNITETLSKPELVWSPRKGKWDKINSVGIAEDGSLVVSTHDGAVWRCVKRTKAHDSCRTYSKLSSKKFKHERIPGLSKIEAIRSTIYGVYVAIRKNLIIPETHIAVQKQELWADIKPLFVFDGLKAIDLLCKSNYKDSPAISESDLTDSFTEDKFDCNLEASIIQYLSSGFPNGTHNMQVGTSTSEARIPVHSFILGRSPVLRNALAEFRHSRKEVTLDNFTIKNIADPENNIKTTIVFQGLEFFALFNLVLYLYTDSLTGVLELGSHNKSSITRSNQIRDDLSIIASHLKLEELRIALRSMIRPKKCLSVDMYFATLDPNFFEDGDTIIELEDLEVRAHSAILCQRCPFFKGLFNGRAAGQWLLARRQDSSKSIRVNLKHIQSETFLLIRRYIYADVDTNLFGDIVCGNIDEFADLVLGVMAMADELMLDRLSQICQKVICYFVNDRNICNLLNVIAPCSVSFFKDFALDYICQRLESMLENHFLNNLGDNLLQDLNEAVRKNQLTYLPFVKSRDFYSTIFQKYPELCEEIKEERIRRHRDLAFVARLRDEGRPSPMSKPRDNVLKLNTSGPFDQQVTALKFETLKKSIPDHNKKYENSVHDPISTLKYDHLITDDSSKNSTFEQNSSASAEASFNHSLDETTSVISKVGKTSLCKANQNGTNLTPVKGWSAPAPLSSKLEMRQIMTQAALNRTSTLSGSPESQKTSAVQKIQCNLPKLSQRERKKKHQILPDKSSGTVMAASEFTSAPWNDSTIITRVSSKKILDESPPEASTCQKSLHLKAMQTISLETNNAEPICENSLLLASSSPHTSRLKSERVQDKSTSYFQSCGRVEPTLRISLTEIIWEQKREQEIYKQAHARRSLRDIQEEQAFQEWWDRESRRIQIAEATNNTAFMHKEKREKNDKNLSRDAHKRSGNNRGYRKKL